MKVVILMMVMVMNLISSGCGNDKADCEQKCLMMGKRVISRMLVVFVMVFGNCGCGRIVMRIENDVAVMMVEC